MAKNTSHGKKKLNPSSQPPTGKSKPGKKQPGGGKVKPTKPPAPASPRTPRTTNK